MNKEEIIKEVIDILDKSDYIDLAEHLYDGLKKIKREITLNTVHDFLWALESSTVIDVDGKVSVCIEKIKPLLDYMNNERYNQIIDEVYKNYWSNAKYNNSDCLIKQEEGSLLVEMRFYYKQEFINKCKTDPEFSERWGLKIEERELSLEERSHYANSNHYEVSLNIKMFTGIDADQTLHEQLDMINIPTKLITITYKDEIIEVYE